MIPPTEFGHNTDNDIFFPAKLRKVIREGADTAATKVPFKTDQKEEKKSTHDTGTIKNDEYGKISFPFCHVCASLSLLLQSPLFSHAVSFFSSTIFLATNTHDFHFYRSCFPFHLALRGSVQCTQHVTTFFCYCNRW